MFYVGLDLTHAHRRQVSGKYMHDYKKCPVETLTLWVGMRYDVMFILKVRSSLLAILINESREKERCGKKQRKNIEKVKKLKKINKNKLEKKKSTKGK